MNRLNSYDSRFITAIIGILALMMIFFPVLVLKDSETAFTGLEIAFGKEFASLGPWASGQIEFNPLVLFAFMLPIAGALSPMLKKNGYLFSVIFFISAAIFFFLIPELTTVTLTVLGNSNPIDVTWTYGIGLILAASLSIIGGLIALFKLYKLK